VPISGTPSRCPQATERWLRLSRVRVFASYRGFHHRLQLRVAPPCFTLASSVARLGAVAPSRAVQTARLLQATDTVPVAFAVPFFTRPDPGEDDSIWSSVPPLLHGALGPAKVVVSVRAVAADA